MWASAWAAVVNALPTIAAAVTVAGTAYGVAASADGARRQKNALARAEKRAETEMEANLRALQNVDGGTSPSNITDTTQKSFFNKTWVYIGAAVLGVGVLWFAFGKKRKA